MSKEQELPTTFTSSSGNVFADLDLPNADLLAQIATLTAQVESCEEFIHGYRDEISDLRESLAAQNKRAECAEEELAALREGAKIKYRVDRIVGNYRAPLTEETTLEEATELKGRWGESFLVEIITRERILDATPPCKYCGPNCIPGAAHNAREEDSATWEADATGGEV